MIDAKMTLEAQQNGIQKTVYCRAGEVKGRRLLITLTNNNAVVPLDGKAVTAYIQQGSNTPVLIDPVLVDIDTENDNVVLTLPTLTVNEYTVELKLAEDVDGVADTLYTPCFRIISEASLGAIADETADIGVVVSHQLDIATGVAVLSGDLSDSGYVVVYDGAAVKKAPWKAASVALGGAYKLNINKNGSTYTCVEDDHTTAKHDFTDFRAAVTRGAPILVRREDLQASYNAVKNMLCYYAYFNATNSITLLCIYSLHADSASYYEYSINTSTGVVSEYTTSFQNTSNDYTTAEKNKLESLKNYTAGAGINISDAGAISFDSSVLPSKYMQIGTINEGTFSMSVAASFVQYYFIRNEYGMYFIDENYFNYPVVSVRAVASNTVEIIVMKSDDYLTTYSNEITFYRLICPAFGQTVTSVTEVKTFAPTIDSSSTNNEIPTALAVKNYVDSVPSGYVEILDTETPTLTLNYTEAELTTMFYAGTPMCFYGKPIVAIETYQGSGSSERHKFYYVGYNGHFYSIAPTAVDAKTAVRTDAYQMISATAANKLSGGDVVSGNGSFVTGGQVYTAIQGSGASVYISDTEPSNPTDGMLWIDTADDTIDDSIPDGDNLSY